MSQEVIEKGGMNEEIQTQNDCKWIEEWNDKY